MLFNDRLRLAECGSTKDMIYVGWCYLHGDSVDQSVDEGLKWYFKAAAAGDPEAQVRLGEAFELGEGVSRNCDESWRFYEAALSQESFHGYYAVAVSYYFGSGCRVRDVRRALHFFDEAARRGHVVSLIQSGRLRRSGSFGFMSRLVGVAVYPIGIARTLYCLVFARNGDSLWDSQRWLPRTASIDRIRKGTFFE